jgi:tetratricopeptide (TPR) repeat protein
VESILRKQVNELGKEIARGVGLAERKVEDIPAQITDVTTSSMDAYRYFIRAREEYERQYDIEAMTFLQKAVVLDSTFAMAYLYLGRANASQSNVHMRDENYRKAMIYSAKTSEKERMFIQAAYAGVIEKDVTKRIEILKTLAKKFPKEKTVFTEIGIELRGKGMLREAVDVLNRALSLDPNYGNALNEMSYAYADMKDYGKAIGYLERYASANPGDANPLDSMGDMYFYMGDLGLAKAKYEEAVGIKGYFQSSFKISYIDGLMEDYPGALEWIDYYRAHLPPSVPTGGAHAWKAYFYVLMGQRWRALAEIAQARRIWSSLGNEFFAASADYMKAWILLIRREYAEGLKIAEQSHAVFIGMGPQNRVRLTVDLALYRALAALETGRPDSVAPCIAFVEARMSQIQPIWLDHYRYISTLLRGAVLLAQAKTDSAIAVSGRVVDSRPPGLGVATLPFYTIVSLYPPVRDVLARAYIQKGRITEAIAEYERLSTFDPKREGRLFISPEYHLSLARLYEKAGSKEKAVSEYEKFLRIWKDADADIPELIDAKAALARLKM